MVVTEFKLTAAASSYGISATGESRIDIGVVEFGACATEQVDAALVRDDRRSNSVREPDDYSHRNTGIPFRFLIASRDGDALTSGNTFTGSANGTRYVVSFTAWTDTAGGGGRIYLPGNAVGSTAAGGRYWLITTPLTGSGASVTRPLLRHVRESHLGDARLTPLANGPSRLALLAIGLQQFTYNHCSRRPNARPPSRPQGSVTATIAQRDQPGAKV